MTVKSSHLFPSFRQMFVGLNFSQSLDIFLCSPVQNLYDSFLTFLDIMDATDIKLGTDSWNASYARNEGLWWKNEVKNIIYIVWIVYKFLFREMFDLFNVNDQKGLTIYEIENGINDMTQTGDLFDRLNMIWKCIKYIFCYILVRRPSMMPLNLPPNLSMRKRRIWRKNWTLSKWGSLSGFWGWLIVSTRCVRLGL